MHVHGNFVNPLCYPDRGRLKMKAHPLGPTHSDLLPTDPNFKDCRGDNSSLLCFKAGESTQKNMHNKYMECTRNRLNTSIIF